MEEWLRRHGNLKLAEYFSGVTREELLGQLKMEDFVASCFECGLEGGESQRLYRLLEETTDLSASPVEASITEAESIGKEKSTTKAVEEQTALQGAHHQQSGTYQVVPPHSGSVHASGHGTEYARTHGNGNQDDRGGGSSQIEMFSCPNDKCRQMSPLPPSSERLMISCPKCLFILCNWCHQRYHYWGDCGQIAIFAQTKTSTPSNPLSPKDDAPCHTCKREFQAYRYHCLHCPSFSLCGACRWQSIQNHHHKHVFVAC